MFRSQRCDSTPHWQHPALTLDRSISILIVKSGPVIKPDTPQNTDPQKLFAKFFRYSKAEVRLAAGGRGNWFQNFVWWLNGHFVAGEIEFLHVWTCQSPEIGHRLTSLSLSGRKVESLGTLPIGNFTPEYYSHSCHWGEFCLTYSSICRRDQWVKPLQMINRLVPTTILLYYACSPTCFVHINQILLTRPLAHNCFWSGLEHMTLT